MNEPFLEAESYFEGLWHQANQKLAQSDIKPAAMEGGLTIPVDYCVSTISRIAQQSVSPIKPILQLTQRFSEKLPTQFFYPETSMHITLLGCTQRFPNASTFTEDWIGRINLVCRSVLSTYTPVRLSLKGVGLVGNQAFIQAYPHSRTWENIRADLESKLLEIGEHPISYPNKAPIHLNFMRLLDVRPESIHIVRELLEETHTLEISELNVDTVELLITDFVVSKQNTRIIERFKLS